MITDKLSDAIDDIEYYLNHNHFGIYYRGKVRSDIEALIEHMKRVLETLDQPPKVMR